MSSLHNKTLGISKFKKLNSVLFVTFVLSFFTLHGQIDLPIRIVTTNTILQDIVKNIGGERIKSQCLVTADSGSHSFDPSPADIVLINSAHLIITNGLHLDDSLKKIIVNSGYSGPIIEAASNIPHPLKSTHEHSDAYNIDPHAWHDLSNGRSYVRTITAALIDLDPDGEAIYSQSAFLYSEEIRSLDTWAKRLLFTIPPERRYLVTSHQSLQYLAHAYGLEIQSIEKTTPQHEPDIQRITELIQFIQKHNIRSIFTESGINRKFTEQIAREANISVGKKLFTDSLAPTGHSADTYLGMFRFNVTKIHQLLNSTDSF